MARVVGILGSARKNGNSAALLTKALAGAAQLAGVETERVDLFDYEFDPCTGCGVYVQSDEHVCNLPDDMGRDGEGELFQKLLTANGFIIANPTYGWGTAAKVHTFIERFYPFTWSGRMMGIPFASMSIATNQGMHRQAEEELCRWGCAKGWRHIGGLPVHYSTWEEALPRAWNLGQRLAEAALVDEAGRVPLNEEERFLYYLDRPWDGLEKYLDNLTDGTLTWEHSLVKRALDFRPYGREQMEHMELAGEELKRALGYYFVGEREKAAVRLARASSYWTHATWGRGSSPPSAYKPLPKE